MTAIEKMERYLMTVDRNIVSFGDILDKVKELAKEEKATESVNKLCSNCQTIENGHVIRVNDEGYCEDCGRFVCTKLYIYSPQDYKGLVEELEELFEDSWIPEEAEGNMVYVEDIQHIVAKFKGAK